MTPPAHKPSRRRRLVLGTFVLASAAVLALAGLLAWGEAARWPLLQAPLERLMSAQLGQAASFSTPRELATTTATATPSLPAHSEAVPAFELQLLGGIRLRAAHLGVSSAAWSSAPHLLHAQDVVLELRYGDLWRTWRGEHWRIHSLQARHVSAHLERHADGRASWPTNAQHRASVQFGRLRLQQLRVMVHDATRALALQVQGSASSGPATTTLRATASGRYGRHAIKAELAAVADSPASAGGNTPQAAQVKLKASIGRARLDFDGRVSNAAAEPDLAGRFVLDGPSLAAVGNALGLTLPTTAAFHSAGLLTRTGARWHVVVEQARIGLSQLNGAFVYRTDTAVPLLAGRLGGTRLALVDLGPALGVVPDVAPGAAPGGQSRRALPRAAAKLLPDRPFDLAALRRMDANVLVAIDEVDLNRRWLEPLRALQTQLTLSDGVLRLQQLQAALAGGRLAGDTALDGRTAPAQWRTELRWSAVQLQRWFHPVRRAAKSPPYASGQLQGTAALAGHGISTAEILGSLSGRVRMELREGTVSHLAVEAAGLDVAQGLGVWIKGDDALSVSCAVADLNAVQGVLRARLVVLDSSDSVLWLTGSLSLAAESLDLSVHVAPKDFSPLALRTPLLLRGSFAKPAVSLQKDALARKAGAALLLALLNPAAALIPFIDVGNPTAARQHGAECEAALGRRLGAPSSPP